MSKPDYVKVWEFTTGIESTEGQGKFVAVMHRGNYITPELVPALDDALWTTDVLNGLREKDFGVWIFKSGIIIHQFNPDRGGAVGEGPLPEALLAACLKCIANAR